MEYKNYQESTPSSGKNRLVEKVRNSNIHCDSPFRLMPNISTPPSGMFKIRNPFESPLLERLHLPVCSPGLFAKSSPKKEEKFIWSICDISNLKPAEIDTNYFQENISTTLDPQTESKIQDKISNFFRLNAVVPSPAPRGTNGKKPDCSTQNCNRDKKESFMNRILNEDLPPTEAQMISNSDSAMDISNISDGKAQYLPEDVYYKKLFDFESQTPNTSPLSSPSQSPVQFSPLKELEVKSFSDEMDRKSFNICGLSPITPENETCQRDNSKSMSIRESKSVCRLVFSENNTDSAFDFDQAEEKLEDTVTESGLTSGHISNDNVGAMSIDEVIQDCDYDKMDISLIHTPKSGLFVSQRKRLSDSFKDLHSSFSALEDIVEYNANDIAVKSGISSEGSSDLGYHSENVVIAPSLTENTWNNSHVFSSTPTKRKK